VPSSKSGIHSFNNKNSIQILGWLSSTSGRVLHYIDENGKETFINEKKP